MYSGGRDRRVSEIYEGLGSTQTLGLQRETPSIKKKNLEAQKSGMVDSASHHTTSLKSEKWKARSGGFSPVDKCQSDCHYGRL